MIGHLRSSSDHIGKFSFDSFFITIIILEALADLSVHRKYLIICKFQISRI